MNAAAPVLGSLSSLQYLFDKMKVSAVVDVATAGSTTVYTVRPKTREDTAILIGAKGRMARALRLIVECIGRRYDSAQVVFDIAEPE